MVGEKLESLFRPNLIEYSAIKEDRLLGFVYPSTELMNICSKNCLICNNWRSWLVIIRQSSHRCRGAGYIGGVNHFDVPKAIGESSKLYELITELYNCTLPKRYNGTGLSDDYGWYTIKGKPAMDYFQDKCNYDDIEDYGYTNSLDLYLNEKVNLVESLNRNYHTIISGSHDWSVCTNVFWVYSYRVIRTMGVGFKVFGLDDDPSYDTMFCGSVPVPVSVLAVIGHFYLVKIDYNACLTAICTMNWMFDHLDKKGVVGLRFGRAAHLIINKECILGITKLINIDTMLENLKLSSAYRGVLQYIEFIDQICGTDFLQYFTSSLKLEVTGLVELGQLRYH